jgi:hypothetical protein
MHVLFEASITHLGEAEHSHDDPDRMPSSVSAASFPQTHTHQYTPNIIPRSLQLAFAELP